MIYYLFEYLESVYQLPGAGVFQYISFRAALAVITSLLVSMVFGGKIINLIRNKQIGEEVRTLGLEGEAQKERNTYYGRLNYTSSYSVTNTFICKTFKYLYRHNANLYSLVGSNWIH